LTPLDRARRGLGASLHAARLMLDDGPLRRAAVLPTLLTVLGAALVAGLLTLARSSSALHDLEPGELPTAGGLQAFLVTFVAIASMPPTLLQRQWLQVAHEARRALGLPPGEDPFPGEWYLHMLWRESGKTLRQAVVVSMGLLPVVAFIHLLPFGDYEAAAVGAGWTFYWVVIDAFELPIEVLIGPRHATPEPWYARGLGWLGRRAWPFRIFGWTGRMLTRLTRPWGEEVQFTERHRWETAGFAAGVGLVLAIPLAGLFFRSVAITAATALVGSLGAEGEAVPPSQDPPPLEPPPLNPPPLPPPPP
jgi:hypothetical protein